MNKTLLTLMISSFALAHANESNDLFSTIFNKKLTDKMHTWHAKLPRYTQKSNQDGVLDLANEQDYALFLEHMSFAGVTPEEAPMFYAMAEEARQQALSQPTYKGYSRSMRQGSVQSIHNGAIPGDSINSPVSKLHQSILNPRTIMHPASNSIQVLIPATSNINDEIIFAYTSVVIRDPNGNQIGLPGASRAYGDSADRTMARAVIKEKSALDPYQPDDVFTIDAMTVYKTKEGEIFFKRIENKVQQRVLKQAFTPNAIGSFVLTHPLAKGDDPTKSVKICLNRDHEDCDYSKIYDPSTPSAHTQVRVPLSGSIKTHHYITKENIFVPGTSSNAITGLETGAWIMAGNAGADGEWASLRHPNDPNITFYDYLSIKYEVNDEGFIGSIITWDIPQEEALFGVGGNTQGTLFKAFSEVHWEIRIIVSAADVKAVGEVNTNDPIDLNDHIILQEGIITSLGADSAKALGPEADNWIISKELPYLIFELGCLAKGTLIKMADGTEKPIEAVMVGDQVTSNEQILEVLDTSIGYEAIPMVHVTDSQGNELLLTETHPVVTLNRGVIWANELEIGDQLDVAEGSSEVKAITFEEYNDTVHNLELEPISGETEAHEVMYANGILVGDLGYQSALNTKEQAPSSVEAMLESLPEEWHQDYLNSLKRKDAQPLNN